MTAADDPAFPVGNPAERRSLDAYVKLMRAAESVTARAHRHLAEHELSVSQFWVLEALLHCGPLCQREIARKILKSDGNVTVVLTHLERRGLIERARDPANRRSVRVRLSDRGRELATNVFPCHAAGIARALAVLDPDEQEQLAILCRKLGLGQEES